MCRNHSHAVVRSLGSVTVVEESALLLETVQAMTFESPNGGRLTFLPGLHLLLPSASMADSLRSVELATGEQYGFTSPQDVIAFAFTGTQPAK